MSTVGYDAGRHEFRHHNQCDYANHPDDPDAECHCTDPRSNPVLECGHRLEDYCFCSEY